MRRLARAILHPVQAIGAIAARPTSAVPLFLLLLFTAALASPVSFARQLAQAEHGIVPPIAGVVRMTVMFAPLSIGLLFGAGLVVGLLARRRRREASIGNHAIAAIYCAVPSLLLVGAWSAARLAWPSLPAAPLHTPAGVLLALPSLLLFLTHARSQLRAAEVAVEEPDRSPRDKLALALLLGAGLLAAALLVDSVIRVYPDVRPPGSGERVAALTLTRLDAAPIALDELRGQIVFLDFWATWCPPCVRSLPTLDRFAAQHTSDGVVVIAVNRDEADADREALVRDFAKTHGLSALSIALDDGPAADRFRVSSLPTLFVLDAEGRIAGSHVGGAGEGELEKMLERARGL